MQIITTNPTFKHMQSWNGFAIPAGYALVPEDMDTSDFYAYNGCVDITVKDNTVTDMVPNITAWEGWKITQPDPSVALSKEIRRNRDQKLCACDWTQMGDCPLDDNSKIAWQAYRQALRDVPEQVGFPNEITWPEMPE